jgi:hypothetical protein
MTVKSPPPHVTLCIFLLAVVTIAGLSCSSEPQTILLRMKYGSPGSSASYKFSATEAGKVYDDSGLVRDFDIKVEGDIVYNTKDTLPDGGALILEKNRWSWDEPADDSGQVKRVTKEYAYKVKMQADGKIVSLDMIDKPSQQSEDYVRNFAEQANPVFPSQKVAPGYSWMQTVPVEIVDGTVDTSKMTFKFKGTARKMGYNCAVLEYSGNLVLPVFPNPDDTVAISGIDRIDISGISYFAIDEGIIVTSDERRRTNRDRKHVNDKGERSRRSEIDMVLNFELVGLKGD